jgi:hypothetical protein
LTSALQSANPSFNARSKPQRRSEPALRFASFATLAFRTRLGQSHTFDADITGELFIRFGEHAAISRSQLGWAPKQFLMIVQTGTPLCIVGRIAPENPILGDDAAIDFAVPELASKFSLLRGCFAPLNNRGVRLKQTDDLFWCRHRHMLEDSPRSLLNHATHQGHILCQEIGKRQGALVAALSQVLFHPLDLRQNPFHDLDQLAIESFAQFFGFF